MTEQSVAGAVSRVFGAAVGAVRRRRRAGRRRRRDDHRRCPVELNALYVGTPPWDIGRPQSAFVALAEAGLLRGRVLDVGCGTGEHALLAAGRGLSATGIDAAAAAIAIAQRKAHDRQLPARFLVWDALELAALGEQFDTVLDCGLFHVFDHAARSRYIDTLSAVIPTGGRYFMLCFRGRGRGWRPRGLREEELRSAFAHGWQVDAIEAAAIETTAAAGRAWRVAITRT